MAKSETKKRLLKRYVAVPEKRSSKKLKTLVTKEKKIVDNIVGREKG